MTGEAGGWMWLLIDVALVAIFAVALAYAVMAWRRRPGGAERAGEQATEEIYHRGDP